MLPPCYARAMDRKSAHGDRKVSVWLPRTLWERAKSRAIREGRPLRLLIIDAIADYLRQKKEGR